MHSIWKQEHEPTKLELDYPSETAEGCIRALCLCQHQMKIKTSKKGLSVKVSVNFLMGVCFSNLWRNMIFENHLWWFPLLENDQPLQTHLQKAQQLFQELQHLKGNEKMKQQFPKAQSYTKLPWAAHSQPQVRMILD